MSIFENQAIFPGAELFLIKQFMQVEGFKPAQWLLGTALPESALQHPDTRVSLHQFDMIYRNVFRLVQTSDIGLRLGQTLNLSRWGMLTLALTSARTLGAALQIANEHRALVRSRFNLETEAQGEQVKIVVKQQSSMAFPVSEAFGFEMLIASLQRQISDLLGKSFAFSKIQLHYPEPLHHRLYKEHCACPIEFGAPASALWLPTKTLKRLLPLANQIAEKQAIAICELEMKRVNQIQEGDICWVVKNELTHHETRLPNLDTLAVNLSINSRTLRRRLKLAGTSYRELSQQYQLQLALKELAHPNVKLNDIAEKCGFSDVGSFRQAFMRWTKMTPNQYRAQFKTNH